MHTIQGLGQALPCISNAAVKGCMFAITLDLFETFPVELADHIVFLLETL